MKNYFKVLLEGCLKVEKGDNLFISLSYKDKSFIESLVEASYELGVSDLNITYYELNDTKVWARYINDGSKFLFLVNENWLGTLSSRIASGFRNGEIPIDYTIAPSLPALFKYDRTIDYIKEEDPTIGFNKSNSQYNKAITTFKNYKFNEIALRTLSGTALSFQFSNEFRYCRNGVINVFPKYGIELLPSVNSAKGFIDASKTTIIDGLEVDGLRLQIRNGEVIDFDSDNEHDLVREIFRRSNLCQLESICLIDDSMPLYNYLGRYGNEALDINANPYITLTLKDLRKIYVPIESKTLTVIGQTNKGNVKIYEKEKITIF